MAFVALALSAVAVRASLSTAVPAPEDPQEAKAPAAAGGGLASLMQSTRQTIDPGRASLRRIEVRLRGAEDGSWLLHEARRSREGRTEVALVVLAPDELRGRALLIRRAREATREWTYVPGEGVAESAAGETLERALGAPLTAEDLGLLDEADGEFALLGAESRNNVQIYEVLQDPPEDAPYAEIVTRLHSADLLPLRRDFYSAEGTLVRRRAFDRIERTDGVPTPLRIRTLDLRDGSRTRIDVRDVRFERSLPDDLFEPARLARLEAHSGWRRLSAPVEVLVERGVAEVEAMPWELARRSAQPRS